MMGNQLHSADMFGLVTSVSLALVITIFGFQESNAEAISLEKCKEYSKIFDTCSARSISGDKLANLGDFPYMAFLKYENISSTNSYRCVGALVSKNYVIAPAYCITLARGRPVSVKLGDLSIHETTTSNQEIKVIDTQIHPDYNQQQQTNVLGLLKLETDVVFSKNVHPICLSDKDLTAAEVIASGWGIARSNADQKRYFGYMLKSVYSVYKQEECEEIYTKLKKEVPKEHLCTGLRKNDCEAVPSGTVEIQNEELPCMHSLVGLVNYGPNTCRSNIPDVYTRIAPYVSWIESVIWA